MLDESTPYEIGSCVRVCVHGRRDECEYVKQLLQGMHVNKRSECVCLFVVFVSLSV